ncbi:tRNA (uridine(34)/cytosine(34)/5-carboxymethylaminomethyluridine(34)-2'-O)-methyltransferase TrmL [Oscillospiraceae bacterium OttesenSCG-928-F05]|nr:tRNA (uridine(34)/cytosine(34)/5-carboxymethylaminomethyluridine(34)-2'-O)-methyltransferase TrmL [Oscillospiraceae bacterium OttesenSCG-928-F05]
MLNIVLVEPEIPMNTGNIARTCAATGSKLHLIEPLGFSIDDRAVRRAGLDYWHLVDLAVYPDYAAFLEKNPSVRPFCLTTKAVRRYSDAVFHDGDFLMFGKETAGLPAEIREANSDRTFRIPMLRDARSLNLANSVAIVCYEALRQTGFPALYP